MARLILGLALGLVAACARDVVVAARDVGPDVQVDADQVDADECECDPRFEDPTGCGAATELICLRADGACTWGILECTDASGCAGCAAPTLDCTTHDATLTGACLALPDLGACLPQVTPCE